MGIPPFSSCPHTPPDRETDEAFNRRIAMNIRVAWGKEGGHQPDVRLESTEITGSRSGAKMYVVRSDMVGGMPVRQRTEGRA